MLAVSGGPPQKTQAKAKRACEVGRPLQCPVRSGTRLRSRLDASPLQFFTDHPAQSQFV
jgi:hypothetical protein